MVKSVGSSDNVFETGDLDLASFLSMEGLEYLGNRVEYDRDAKRPKAIMRFKDDLGKARDLERVFITSAQKQYRDIHKYFLRQAHLAVRGAMQAAADFREDR